MRAVKANARLRESETHIRKIMTETCMQTGCPKFGLSLDQCSNFVSVAVKALARLCICSLSQCAYVKHTLVRPVLNMHAQLSLVGLSLSLDLCSNFVNVAVKALTRLCIYETHIGETCSKHACTTISGGLED